VPPQAVLAMRDRSAARPGGSVNARVVRWMECAYRALRDLAAIQPAAMVSTQAGLVPWIKKRGDLHDGLVAALTRRTAQPWPTSGTLAPTVADAVLAASLARSA
jgi:hypothetical protein